MKTGLFSSALLLLFLFIQVAYGQNIGINEDGSSPNGKAILDIKSTSKGIMIPRLTNDERSALGGSLTTTETGMLVFDSEDASFYFWTGDTWTNLNSLFKVFLW